MKRSLQLLPLTVVLAFVVLMTFLIGCALASTVVPASTRIPPTFTPSLTLSTYVGKQITLAITDPNGSDNKPEISLFIGSLREASGDFSIVADNGITFTIPREWLTKVKLMDEAVKSILGGSDLLLPITKAEFESAGFTYQRDQDGSVDIQIMP